MSSISRLLALPLATNLPFWACCCSGWLHTVCILRPYCKTCQPFPRVMITNGRVFTPWLTQTMYDWCINCPSACHFELQFCCVCVKLVNSSGHFVNKSAKCCLPNALPNRNRCSAAVCCTHNNPVYIKRDFPVPCLCVMPNAAPAPPYTSPLIVQPQSFAMAIVPNESAGSFKDACDSNSPLLNAMKNLVLLHHLAVRLPMVMQPSVVDFGVALQPALSESLCVVAVAAARAIGQFLVCRSCICPTPFKFAISPLQKDAIDRANPVAAYAIMGPNNHIWPQSLDTSCHPFH